MHEFLHRGLQVRRALDTWIHANLERHRVTVHRGVASLATGRRGNIEGLGLERAGVVVDAHGLIPVNDAFQTTAANIYAAGDVIGGPLLASVAMEQARMAVGNAFDLERDHNPAPGCLDDPRGFYGR